jgi:hypothetical protein
MNIDFTKLITWLLPTFLRSAFAWIVQSVAVQFTSLYTDFQLWQLDIRLQAAMTCQVMYLETILNYRLLNSFIRTIYISDGDGVIADFVINVPQGVDVDNYRMIALIEKYKIAGKRYTIGQSAYTYQVNWSDFYCEKVNREFVAEWSDFYCELHEFEDLPTNLLTLHIALGAQNIADGTMWVTSQYPVATQLTVDVQCVLEAETRTENLVIPVGTSQSYVANFSYPSEIIVSQIYLISPESDTTYNYTS